MRHIRTAAMCLLLTLACPAWVGAAAPAAEAKPDAPGGGAGPTKADPARVKKLQERARARMREDQKKYKPDQIREAEALYQVANKNWRTPEAKASLEKMVKQYPDLNRTGCATLYLGQYARGEERERLLKEAVEKYSDCFYGNGVQVGAFGRYLLGLYHLDQGDKAKAEAVFAELRKEYPDAIDHRGNDLIAAQPKSTP